MDVPHGSPVEGGTWSNASSTATRHDRLDETFLPNLQLILIAIYLKKHSQKPN